MEVPYKLTNERPAITVLFSDRFSETYKPFHCSICGMVVFEYNQDYVRTILPSGMPQLDKPGRTVHCSGAITLHGKKQIYELFYEILEAVWTVKSLEDLKTIVIHLASEAKEKENIKCGAKYYLS